MPKITLSNRGFAQSAPQKQTGSIKITEKKAPTQSTSQTGTKKFPLIKDVRAFVMKDKEGASDYHRQPSGHWIIDSPISNPMSVYSKYRKSRTSWGIDVLGPMVVEVETEDGTIGIGTTIGGDPACNMIEHHFGRFLYGQDPRNVELLWDQMWRASMPWGRKGLTVQALSAVDLALWDLIGKIRNEPIYQILGGKTKELLPVYATTAKPGLAKKMGFMGAKIPLPYSHVEGKQGMIKNIDAVKDARDQVGPDFPLMIDCYMSLSVPFAIQLAREVSKLNVKWIEEILPPDDFDGYAEVKRVANELGVLVTTGEHEYSRYGFRELIQRKCADILQPDVTWVGGLTESRRIVSMASAYDIPVVPHGSSVFSYHLQYAFPNCPFAEFLILSPKADEIVPLFGKLFKDEPLPRNGVIELPDKAGWGVDLNDGLNLHRPHEKDWSKILSFPSTWQNEDQRGYIPSYSL